MKKITAILLAALMIAAVFASCNFGTGNVTTADPEQSEAPGGTSDASDETTTNGEGDVTTTEKVDDGTTAEQPGDGTTAGNADTTAPSVSDEDPFKPEEAKVLEILKGGRSKAKIIYPQELSEIAKSLRESLRSSIGVNFQIALDTSVAADSEKVEILIGYTNRPESESIRKFIGYRDYGVYVWGNKLIIAGWSEDTIADAIAKFESTYITSSDVEDISATSDKNYATSGYYQSSAMYIKGDKAKMIAGNYYHNYSIVVPENYMMTEYRFALRLQDMIATKTGVVMPLVFDSENTSDYEILIGNTSRTTASVGDKKYVVNVKDNKVELISDTFYGYDYLYEYCSLYLIGKLNGAAVNAGAVVNENYAQKIVDDGTNSFTSKLGDLRIIYNNVFGFDIMKTTPNGSCMPEIRNLMIAEFYKDFDADILCFEEITGTMRGTMPVTSLLGSYGYKEVSAGRCTTPILYREATIELVEGDEINFNNALCPNPDKDLLSIQGDKYMTWAVFREKATGKKFAVINVHMDSFDDNGPGTGAVEAAAQVELMMQVAADIYAEHGCSVLMGGDMNTTIYDPTCQTLTQGGYKDVQKIADVTDSNKGYFNGVSNLVYVEGIGGAYFTGEAQTDDDYTKSVDHIFASSYAQTALEFKRFEILSDASVSSFADHCAMVLDFNIK